METNNKEALRRTIALARALVETVEEVAPVGAPEGVCYAAMMKAGVTLDEFSALVNYLIELQFVRRSNHQLFLGNRPLSPRGGK